MRRHRGFGPSCPARKIPRQPSTNPYRDRLLAGRDRPGERLPFDHFAGRPARQAIKDVRKRRKLNPARWNAMGILTLTRPPRPILAEAEYKHPCLIEAKP